MTFSLYFPSYPLPDYGFEEDEDCLNELGGVHNVESFYVLLVPVCKMRHLKLIH